MLLRFSRCGENSRSIAFVGGMPRVQNSGIGIGSVWRFVRPGVAFNIPGCSIGEVGLNEAWCNLCFIQGRRRARPYASPVGEGEFLV